MINTIEALIAFRDLAASVEACEPAILYLNECIDHGLTLEEAASRVVEIIGPEGQDFRVWVRQETAAIIDQDFRVCLTDLITAYDNRMAWYYDIYFADLCEAEIEIVTSRWTADEFPNIAASLANGTTVRARDL